MCNGNGGATPLLICVGLPNRDDFKAEMVQSLLYAVAINKEYRWEFFNVQTPFIDDSRNRCVEFAQQIKADYLLFVDSDLGTTNEVNYVGHMISLNEDVVTGVYYQKAYPFRPVVYNFTEEGLIKNFVTIPKTPFYVDASGGGMLLLSKKVLDAFDEETCQRIGKPFNFINYGQQNELREDAAFFMRLKMLGIKTIATPFIQTVHVGRCKYTDKHWDLARARIDQADTGIPGWTTNEELEALKKFAAKSDSIVEIGSHKGRSAKVLLEHCKGDVYCVDLWDGYVEMGNNGTREPIFKGDEVYQEFMGNVGHYPNLHVMRGDSVVMAKSFNGKHVDMVFIDGNHAYGGVKADIQAWMPKCDKIICGHDYSPNWPGVMQAVNESFKEVNVFGTIWWVELEAK